MSSQSSGSSNSVPVAIQTPQNDILDQIAALASDYAQQMYAWGQQAYAQTSQLTDQVVHNFLQSSATASGMAGNAIDRYQNLFQPEENQLIQDANTYASAPRIASEMGRGEAESMEGSDAARQNALKDLQSYGVDPSSGRYASLDRMEREQAGAEAAAAGTTARVNTENTGRQLRSQAIAVGQQYPAQAVNDLNTSLQGIAGAENARLGNANTGAALMNLPNNYLGTAMGLKLPPVGQNSTSRQQSTSSSPAQQPKQDKEKDPNAAQQGQGRGGLTRNDIGQGVAGGASRGGDGFDQGPFTPDPSGDPGQAGGSSLDNWDQGGMSGSGGYNEGLNDNSYDPNNYGDPYDTGTYGQDTSGSSYGDMSSYDPSNYGDASGFGDYSGTPDWSGWGDTSGANNYSQSDQYSYDQPAYGGNDGSGWGDSGGDYARGGAVGGQMGGGRVPASMSPSRGQRTDDVPAQIAQTGARAQLNADEFVIPKDVAMWKGQEFFQNLITKSRQARTGAPAKPAMGQAHGR